MIRQRSSSVKPFLSTEEIAEQLKALKRPILRQLQDPSITVYTNIARGVFYELYPELRVDFMEGNLDGVAPYFRVFSKPLGSGIRTVVEVHKDRDGLATFWTYTERV